MSLPLLGLLVVACAESAAPNPTRTVGATPSTGAKLPVVATTGILADLVKNVGGDVVEVQFMVPSGVDVHSFQSTPKDSTAISRARLIVSNGAGLDAFLDSVLQSARRSDAVQVVASAGLQAATIEEIAFPGEEHADEGFPEEVEEGIHRVERGEISAVLAIERVKGLLSGFEGGEDELKEGLLHLVHSAEEGRLSPEAAIEAMEELLAEHKGEEGRHGHAEGDPHFWQDPLNAIHYVEQIRDGLVQADPANAPAYQANAAAYIQQLRELDQEIARVLSNVPPQRRHLVTFHDAFGYFAQRYGWRVSAFVPTDASQVTPERVIQVMESIRAEGIPAVFAEPQFRPDVMQQAARDTGVVVGTIYSDALDDRVPTYIDMMRFNAKSLAEHLR